MSRRSLLVLFFFGSGAAALAYEVVWIRILSLTLSITTYSLTTVLCAFMAGLAVGSAIAARVVDRLRRPMAWFGAVELGIGLCGLVVPLLLFNLAPAFLAIHGWLGGDGVVFSLARFALAFTVLLVPTTLMGITLPLLSRAVVGRVDETGSGTGALYGANTLGAVVGCVLSGFVLIPEVGLLATCRLAALLNAAIAIGAVVLGRSGGGSEVATLSDAPLEAPPPLPRSARLAALAYGASGFTAMGYEVLWGRALEHYTHNSVYAYSAMLATFLFGLATGSAILSRFADRVRRPLLVLGGIQVAVAASVVVSLLIYIRYETLIPQLAEWVGGITSWGRVILLIFAEAGIAMVVTTLLLGAMFPLVTRTVVDALEHVGARVARVYLINTVGSILGSLLVGFVVLPSLGVRGAFVALIALNAAVGVGLVLAARTPEGGLEEGGSETGTYGVLGAAALVVAVAFLAIPPNLFEAQFRERFGELLFYREEITDTVMVTQAEDGSRMIRYADGRGTAGTPTYVGDRMYGHIPMLLHPDPKRILQITFGVGNSLSSVLQHPVEKVECVELSPGVIDAAGYFTETNRNSLEDPRVELHINDGRNYLLTTGDRYDVIRLDPPELHTRGVVNLYTKEFYELALARLAPGGIFSIWFNNVMTPEEDIRDVLRTAEEVFPHVSIWHDPHFYSWVINGSREPHDPDLAVLLEKFAQPKVKADLATIEIDDPYEFVAHFMFADEDYREWTGEGPLVVDDHTRIDFSTPRSEDAFFGIANYNTNQWLVDLMEPEAEHDVALSIFFRKIRRMASFRKPVFERLKNPDAAPGGAEEARRRIREIVDGFPV